MKHTATTRNRSPYDRGRRLCGCTVAALLALSAVAASAAPEAVLWERWTRHDPRSVRVVDHGVWTDFLGRYLIVDSPSGVNLVRYGEVASDDRQALDSYLSMLQETPIDSLNRNEQIAFWINLYNAYTVKLILDHYPVASIRHINLSGPFRIGPWSAERIEIAGERVTLNDIEHRILRPIWRDPRLHFVLNCASIGCPNLQPVVFRADNTPALLEQAAQEFISHPRAARFTKKQLQLSSIFDWYATDFGGDETAVRSFLATYLEPQAAQRLLGHTGSLRYRYDWSLNEG